MAFHGSRGDRAGTGGALFPNANPSLFSNLHSSQLYPLFPILISLRYCVTTDLTQSRAGAERGAEGGGVRGSGGREVRDWL